MGDNLVVDARGLSCPEPVVLVDKAIKQVKQGTIEVLVDSGTARENVQRLAKSTGWATSLKEEPQNTFRIILSK